MKFLAGLNLLLLAGLLALTLVRQGTELYDVAIYWRAMHANKMEWDNCEARHRILKKQIVKEGLWRRLGMPGQPWLK